MIRIKNYLINKDKVLYIEKHGFTHLKVVMTDGVKLMIECHTEEQQDEIFEKLNPDNYVFPLEDYRR